MCRLPVGLGEKRVRTFIVKVTSLFHCHCMNRLALRSFKAIRPGAERFPHISRYCHTVHAALPLSIMTSRACYLNCLVAVIPRMLHKLSRCCHPAHAT